MPFVTRKQLAESAARLDDLAARLAEAEAADRTSQTVIESLRKGEAVLRSRLADQQAARDDLASRLSSATAAVEKTTKSNEVLRTQYANALGQSIFISALAAVVEAGAGPLRSGRKTVSATALVNLARAARAALSVVDPALVEKAIADFEPEAAQAVREVLA